MKRERVDIVFAYIKRRGPRTVHFARVRFLSVYGSDKRFFPFCGARPDLGVHHTGGTWVFKSITPDVLRPGDRRCTRCLDIYSKGLSSKEYFRYRLVGKETRLGSERRRRPEN